MWIFYFVGLLCLLTLPVLITFMAGQFFLGSAQWTTRLLTGNREAKRLVEGSQTEDSALVSFQADNKRLLDETLLTRSSLFTHDAAMSAHGLSVFVRTQSLIVDGSGQRVGFPWSREERQEAAHVQSVSIVVDTRERVPLSVALHYDVRTEEVSFGDEALLVALLDGGLADALGPGDTLSLTDGCLIVQSPFAAREKRLAKLIDRIAHAGRRLVDSYEGGRPDVAKMLRESLERDVNARVRARSVDHLLELVPHGPQREAAIRIALADGSPAVRLATARRIDERGFDVALEVVRDIDAGEGLRQRALRFIMRRYEPEQYIPILRECLSQDGERIRQLAIRQLGALAHPEAVDWLAAMTTTTDSQTAVDLANALGSIGDEQAELALITLYEKNFDDVKIAAADALGTVGTYASVSHLLPAAESSRVPPALRVAASTAVKLIQARLRHGSAGALSVLQLADAAGHLSLDAAERGALSDAEEPLDSDLEVAETHSS